MNQHSGLTLAYLGDAYYELMIRKHLLDQGLSKVNDLHKKAIKYTSAKGQSTAMAVLLEKGLTETEESVYKRGRNAEATHKPKNVSLGVYHQATGFESLIGYLYLEGDLVRLEEIIKAAIVAISENDEN
ncbi:MAG: ribonuclease III domain-containing protein [Candidatus Izemoplasmatales bacterium]|nr:ribonuclease III domain-containing protein [Candidatus Izemoplasmatales bacterium]